MGNFSKDYSQSRSTERVSSAPGGGGGRREGLQYLREWKLGDKSTYPMGNFLRDCSQSRSTERVSWASGGGGILWYMREWKLGDKSTYPMGNFLRDCSQSRSTERVSWASGGGGDTLIHERVKAGGQINLPNGKLLERLLTIKIYRESKFSPRWWGGGGRDGEVLRYLREWKLGNKSTYPMGNFSKDYSQSRSTERVSSAPGGGGAGGRDSDTWESESWGTNQLTQWETFGETTHNQDLQRE